MAQKSVLLLIQQLPQNGFSEFLKKNGYGEFEDILTKWEITDGEKFLDLNELQMLKWRIPLSTKKKLLGFLADVKQNPQNFIGKLDTGKNSTINRRQSIRNVHGDIQEKLKQVIAPKPIETKKPKPPIPVPMREPSPPLEEYLAMDKPPESSEATHYDESGYLIPAHLPQTETEENDYEPPPLEINITHFGRSLRPNKIPISDRPPLAIPRGSTGEGGYISGPQEYSPPPLLPRVTPKIQLNEEESEVEEVSYEPIDEEGVDFGKSSSEDLASSDVQSAGSDTGTISRFFSIFKGKNSNRNNTLEPRRQQSPSPNLTPSRSPERDFTVVSRSPEPDLRNRPLPALPSRQPNIPVKKFSPVANDPSRVYVNAPPKEEDEVSRPIEPDVKYKQDKSQSEGNLAKETSKDNLTYDNVPNKKPVFPGSYEQYVPENTNRRPLPLPPVSLPQFDLKLLRHNEPSDNRNEEEEEETGEYGQAIFNLNDEQFYRNTDRKGARLLLFDLDDGGFLFRPSKKFFLTLSLKYSGKYFNLGVEKTETNKIRLHTEGDNMSPEFATIRDFINHFTRERLTFQHKGKVAEVFLRKLLPPDRF